MYAYQTIDHAFTFIFSWWDDGASICSRASDFDCHSSRPVTPSRQGRTKVQFEVSQYVSTYTFLACKSRD